MGKIEDKGYKFRFKVIPDVGKSQEFAGFLLSKFVEDEMDKAKNTDYLDILNLRVVDNHLRDILKLENREVMANAASWFREAKEQTKKNNLKKGGEL